MIPLDLLLPFVFATVLIGLAPGPDNLFVLTQSAQHGYRTGLIIILGLCSGLIIHTSAVALGVAALLQTSPAAFMALKTLGALYLVYLAWQAWQAAKSHANPQSNAPSNNLKAMQFYRRGLLMNLSNPKVSIFFLAFLPQFARAENGSIEQQIFILGLLVIFITFLVFSSFALLAGFIKPWLAESPNAQVLLYRITAMLFLALALKLLWGA
ncbi:LysE family translocator [Thiomicrorhabdus chilensis]|uniref:LysE family translocator n=1 Tax=Thiomicrorhabdus chilensis TaxID=63656 RepID=UPI000405D858|nr:LysE family translocator [Thiomicrorhabdus chilensis]